MTTDFPDHLDRTTGELVFPALAPGILPSRTASALLRADVGWRSVLYDEELTLSSLITSMQDLARRFRRIDDTVAARLDGL